MREPSFDETSDETASLASTLIIPDLDFSDDEDIADSLQKKSAEDNRFLRIYALRNQLQEALGSQRNVFNLLSLGKAFFDDAEFLCAFIIWLLDRNITPQQLIHSGLLHHFFVHQYAMLVGDEDVSDNPLIKTYLFLRHISEKNECVKKLLILLKGTFCGVRGTKFNQEDENKFISLNLLYEDFVTDKKIPVLRYSSDSIKKVSVYESYKLPRFQYLAENALALYDIFGFYFLELLDLENTIDKAVFMQIKAEDSVGMIDIFCDKASSHELTVSQIKSIFPHVTDLFATLSYDPFLQLLFKNPLFLTCVIHQPSLLEKIPAAIVKKNLNKLLRKNDVYADIFSLTRLLLTIQSLSLRYDGFFIQAMRNLLFEKAFSSEESDYVGFVYSLRIFSGKEFCQKKLADFQDKLIDEIRGGASYEKILLLRNDFLLQSYLIERAYPELFVDFPYLLDDSPYVLPSFYIQICWAQKSARHFSLPAFLEEINSSFSNKTPVISARILFSVIRKTSDEALLLLVTKYFSEDMKSYLFSAIKICCLKNNMGAGLFRRLFSAIKTSRFLEGQCTVNGVSFMRRPHDYGVEHILLALKWIQLSMCDSDAEQVTKIMQKFFMVDFLGQVLLKKTLITYIRDLANSLQTQNIMSDLSGALINLLKHLERGYIEFFDLLPKKSNEKRAREEIPCNEEPAARRNFFRM